jgi:RimJ/RimL family protein N-acetyltransferase
MSVALRDATDADVDTFYGYQLQNEGRHMAAFTRKEFQDKDFYLAHWAKLSADESVTTKTILFDGEVAGYVGKFVRAGDAEVTYWLGRAYWGKGIASKALLLFLELVEERPLYGRVVTDNVASLRVLQKCGFSVIGRETAFAEARGEDVEETVLELS